MENEGAFPARAGDGMFTTVKELRTPGKPFRKSKICGSFSMSAQESTVHYVQTAPELPRLPLCGLQSFYALVKTLCSIHPAFLTSRKCFFVHAEKQKPNVESFVILGTAGKHIG
jgi:hypothetical protein